MINVNSVNGNSNEAAKEALAARLAAAQAASNGNGNGNAAATAVKADTVEVSQKSVALAAARSDTASKVAETPKEATTATIIESKVEVTNKQVAAVEKSQDQRAGARKAMRRNQRQLRKLVKGLSKLGMGSSEASKIVKNANREANKVISQEIKQAYNDYRSHNINTQSFYNKLYGAAVKKLDGMVSALRDALAQRAASAQSQTVTVEPIETPEPIQKADDNAEKNTEAVKEKANETKSDNATKATAETRVTDANTAAKANAQKNAEKTKEKSNETSEKEAEKTTPLGLEKKEELPPGLQIKAEKEASGPVGGGGKGLLNGEGILGSVPGSINANENAGKADNAFSQIVDFFNGIDKMINGFADKVEGKGNDDEDGQSLLNFAYRLSDMFSGINRAFGRHSDDNVGFRLGMAQVKREAIIQLFDSGHGSGAINRLGDAGEGSGSFNAVSFMSSLAKGINDGLDSYKDIQKAEKKAKEEAKEEAREETVGTVA